MPAIRAEKAPSRPQEVVADLATTSLSSGNTFTIGENRPTPGGTEIDQATTIEIKTRAAHNVLNMESVLAGLWMSQTPNMITAYHKDEQFDNVQILDVHKALAK